jgi:hypothetical protein
MQSMRDCTYETEEIVSTVGKQLEILIIVGTPGQGPRTFSEQSWTVTVIVNVRIKSVNTKYKP